MPSPPLFTTEVGLTPPTGHKVLLSPRAPPTLVGADSGLQQPAELGALPEAFLGDACPPACWLLA